MKQIIETLDKILEVSKEYDTELQNLKEVFLTVPLSLLTNISGETQLRHQKQAFNLLSSYVGSQIESISKFVNEWGTEKRVKYLINYDSHGLTNGKFYDFAVGHEMWRRKREDIYQLIQDKILKYIELKLELKLSFRNYIVKTYKDNLKYFPSEIVKILDKEIANGNEVIEASANEYFKHKTFLKLKFGFSADYRKEYSTVEYRLLNDVHYWKEEYYDYFLILTCGFEKNERK